ncbi:DUF7424 family protein [Meridianimarinicoccus sp. RP-17]|uniref:DUF7424 family protein n=1 Tax=Meridianimarinicoccus zhengii TaxID=2056810 RepID=UPI0013A6C061|nr:hypothetical protein [Phycocomes zhengii]
MFKARKSYIFLAISTLALGGCQVQSKSEIYLSDVKRVAMEDVELSTPLTFRFEIASSSECQSAIAALEPALGQYYQSVDMRGCENEGVYSFVVARVMASMVRLDSEKAETIDQPVYLTVMQWDDVEALAVGFASTPASIVDFQAALPERATDFVRKEPDIRLSATVHNDMSGVVDIIVQSAIVNQYPVAPPFSVTYKVSRRDKLEVVLSDVANAAFVRHDQPGLIATLPFAALGLSTEAPGSDPQSP